MLASCHRLMQGASTNFSRAFREKQMRSLLFPCFNADGHKCKMLFPTHTPSRQPLLSRCYSSAATAIMPSRTTMTIPTSRAFTSTINFAARTWKYFKMVALVVGAFRPSNSRCCSLLRLLSITCRSLPSRHRLSRCSWLRLYRRILSLASRHRRLSCCC